MAVEHIVKAAMTFPKGTGLGWDGLHPRALVRLSHWLLRWIACLLLYCEMTGQWPKTVGVCIIVLPPKTDGGYRPIGLNPWLIRLWMRCRKDTIQNWEATISRGYLYAGKGKGADVAVWKQAARAEAAAATVSRNTLMAYGQLLLDLIKAFERIPHARLAREAAKLGYQLWLLRLALAAYRLPRTLRIGQIYYFLVVACRVATAGSCTATTEMKIMMIHIIDAAMEVYENIEPTLFVDDVSAESVAADEETMVNELVGFTKLVGHGIMDSQTELSDVKCKCNASTNALGKRLQAGLKAFKVTYEKKVESLGGGLGGRKT